MCGCSSSIPIILGTFVLISSVIWWMNTKFEQILNELKKK